MSDAESTELWMTEAYLADGTYRSGNSGAPSTDEQQLLQLVADLHDPHCNLVQDGDPTDGPTCLKHNWLSGEHDGRECPHVTARRWLRGAPDIGPTARLQNEAVNGYLRESLEAIVGPDALEALRVETGNDVRNFHLVDRATELARLGEATRRANDE